MRKTNEEKRLLAKLASGALDGMVGNDKFYGGYKNVYVGKYIKNGVPVSYKEGESSRFFNFTAVPIAKSRWIPCGFVYFKRSMV